MKATHYLPTLVLAVVALAVTLPQGGGPFLLLLLPVFVAYLGYQGVCMFRRAEARRRRGIRLGIWTVVLALAAAVQTYWSHGTRSQAEMVVQQVLAHRARLGVYPASLAEIGLVEAQVSGRWKVRYSVQDGRPRLIYPAALMPLTTYEYDFAKLAWRQNAD